MWSKKSFIITLMIAAVLLLGSIAGVALAEGEAEDTPQTTFVQMVADRLGITTEQLKNAFCEARTQMQELDSEDRNAEQFKGILAEILYTEYGIEYGALENAITQAKEAMHEQLEAYQAQIRERVQARRAELQAQFEARREQLRQRLEAHSSEQQEWLEARREQLRQRLEARRAELHEWFESLTGEQQQGWIEAWRNRLQEWREAQKGELQGRIEAWQNRVQEWRESQGNSSSPGTVDNGNGNGTAGDSNGASNGQNNN